MTAVRQEIDISPMTEHDLLEVVEIEEKSGLSRWGWAAYYAELESVNRGLMLVARNKLALRSDPILGYIVARETAGELHINNVAVRDEHRRKGIGELLLRSVISAAQKGGATTAFLEVRSENRAAQALYDKCGFKSIARRANYYSDPREDALVMSLVLR